MTPYTNTKTTTKYIIREFNENIEPTELLWHQDLKSRKVTILEGDGWYFQKENSLPLALKQNDVIFIANNK
jgi:hypothetical protein